MSTRLAKSSKQAPTFDIIFLVLGQPGVEGGEGEVVRVQDFFFPHP